MNRPNEGGAPTVEDGVRDSQQVVNSEQSDSTDSSNKDQPSIEELQKEMDSLRRYKDDMLKYKDEARMAKEQLEQIKVEALKEKEDYKSLYEQEMERRARAEESLGKFSQGYFHDKKYSEVRALALKAGLRKDAESDLDLLSLDEVKVEKTDQGRVLVHGADTFVDNLKRNKPHWFKQSSAMDGVNTRGGSPHVEKTPQELTAEYMVKLERKDPAKYKELLPKFLEQRRRRAMQF